MRIIICTNAYPPRFLGGAELVAHEQARALISDGHDVVVFAGDFEGVGPRHSQTVEIWDGVTVYRVKTTSEDYDPSFLNFIHPDVDEHFVELLQDFNPQIVHCHNIVGLSARIPILAKERGTPVVCTLHDYWGFCLRNTLVRPDGASCRDISVCQICLPHSDLPLRLRKDLIGLSLDHVDIFIAPSANLARGYIDAGIAPKRIRVLPNGIDVDRFSPARNRARNQPPVLAYVGHFGVHKGVDTLIAALPLLHGRHDFRIVLVGQGPAEGAYRAQLEANGMSGHVEFRGLTTPAAMPDFYRSIDVLILPSIWGENQPVCIMEAMATGLPVIASRLGGIPELITHGENGLLFAPGEASGLADAIGVMLADPNAAVAMGARGRVRVLRQTYLEQVRSQLLLYRALLDDGVDISAHKAIVGIAGPYRTRLRRRDRNALQENTRDKNYLIPLDWLTASQRESLAKIRVVKTQPKWVGKLKKWFGAKDYR